MVSKFLKTSFLFSLLFLAATAFAQPVQVSVALAPPYPVHLEDYAQMKGQIIVSLVNTSQTFLQLRLVPSVKGQNGVSATLKPGYRPATSLSLGPLETKVLTGAQLQSLNMGLSLENMDIKGVSVQQIIRTETLPEGMYDLCIRAFDFNSNTQLSKDGVGCSMFNITWYDPPVVVNPMDKAHVQPLTPQFLNISWTPSGLGGITRYRLTLMDLTANGLFNPNDAFDMGFPPFFQKEYLITLGYPYSTAEPPLTVGHQYAVRVQAYDPQGNLKFKNDGKSAVTTFTYGGSGGGVPNGPGGIVNNDNSNNPNYSFNCAGDATAPQPADQVLSTGIPANAELKIGNFTVKNVQMSFNGSGYTGTGAIKLDFIKTVVKVEFTNIKINAKKEVFGESKITAVVDANNLYDQALANSEAGTIDLPTATLKNIEQKVNELSRLISKMDGVAEKGLPLGLDNNKGNVALVGMIFKPTGAFVNAVYGTEIPESISGDYLCFAQKGIGLQPGGFGPEGGSLTLAKDIDIALSTHASLKFLKGADTYLSMDCTGFKELSVAGKMVFSRERALPLDAQGNVIADVNTKLSADFKVKGAAGLSKFIAQTKLSHDFAVPQAKNFVFKRPNNGNLGADLVLDFSDVESAPGFAAGFPGKGNAWKGVYFKGLTLVLPEPFKKGNQKVSLALSNLLIDKQGISGTFELNKELLKTSEGSLAGLGLGISYLKIVLSESNLSEGSIKGKVLTPISSTAIGYNCTVSAGGDEGASVEFGIEEIPGLDIDMWVAKAEIEEISSISVTKNQNNKWSAAIDLTGTLSINLKGSEADNGGVKKFNLPGLDFEHLKVNTNDGGTPTFEIGVLEFDNLNLPQIKLGNFELNLDSIALKSMPGNKYGLGFPLSVCLLGQDNDGEGEQQGNANTIMGETEVLFVGKYDAGKKRFVYDHIECKKITVDATIGPLLEMKGSLAIYSDDAKYGDGFRGELHAKAEGIKIQIDFIGQFGKKGSTKYCFVDAMAKFPGIPIPATTMAINGFGGGFWYNMEQASAPEPRPANEFTDKMAGEGEVGKSNSEVVYNVVAGKLGFKACVAFCMVGSQEVFNGDVTFAMQLDIVDISLDWLKLNGNAYFMQNINDRSGSSAVTMTAEILIVPEDKLFEGSFGVDISVLGGALTGGGEVELHFKGKGGGEVEWWLKAGKWSEAQAQQPWKDKSRINIGVNYKLGNMLDVEIRFFAYLMVGNKLPGLPPIPDIIYTNLPALKKGGQQPTVNDAVTSGKGFNLGAGIYAGIDLSVLFFYARCTTLIGFDIVVQKNFNTCGSKGYDYGINGWYAKGQGYAYMSGEAGLQLDVWFWKGQLKLLDVKTGAILKAELPNPIYIKGDFAIYGEVLGGLITIDADLHFEMGEKCESGKGYFGDYPMISSVMPEDKKDVDLFTDPSVSFNFRNNHTYTLVEGDDHQVQMQVLNENITFERKSGNTWKAVEGKLVWNGEKNGASFIPNEMFEVNTTYRWKIVAKGYEYNKGKLQQGAVTEDTSHVFTTAKTKPDIIPWKEIVSSFPYPRQRFHAPASGIYGENGNIEMSKSGMGYVLQEPAPSGMTRKNVARFTELETGKRIETTLTYEGDRFWFEMPYDQMSKQKTYRIDLLRIFQPIKLNLGLAAAPTGPSVQGWNQKINQLNVQKTKLAGKNASNKGIEKKLLGGLYFRTSKYSTMESKLNALKVKKTVSASLVYDIENGIMGWEDCPVVLINSDEGFDGYDLKGYDLNPNDDDSYSQPEPPILNFESDPGAWLEEKREKFWTTLGGYKEGKWNLSNIRPAEANHLDRWAKTHNKFNENWPYPDQGYLPEPLYRTVVAGGKQLNYFGTPEMTTESEMHGFRWDKELETALRSNGHLAGNEGFMKPAPPLSNAEIAAAKAKGKQYQQQQEEEEDINILDLAGMGGNNGGGGGGGMQNPGLGLAAFSPDKQYFAVVDYRPWLANADWEAIKMMYMYYAIKVWENSKPGYITEIRDCLQNKGKPGKLPKGNYSVKMKIFNSFPKTLDYQIK